MEGLGIAHYSSGFPTEGLGPVNPGKHWAHTRTPLADEGSSVERAKGPLARTLLVPLIGVIGSLTVGT